MFRRSLPAAALLACPSLAMAQAAPPARNALPASQPEAVTKLILTAAGR